MGRILIPGLPEAEPAAEPWPVDEHTIRVDEMFARQLDNEFSAGVRGLLHDPETGVAAQRGEAALEAIAGAMPALGELKERTLSQAIGPRQRSILEPMIETRLDWAAGTLGQLAQRATVEVDDQSVADRIAGLNQDAATSWQDPAYLRKLGRTAVEELRYQGERRGWDVAETDTRVRTGLSDLYAGAVETAIRQDNLDSAADLYDHARPIIDPERQTAIDRRFARAHEDSLLRDVDRELTAPPLDPARPPDAETIAARAAELLPKEASEEVRARIGQVAEAAYRRLDRQWNKQQSEAGVAALEWVRREPYTPVVLLPQDARDWLAPDQWSALEALEIVGHLETDGDLFERLDRLLVYEPDRFAALDLDRHRLSLDDEDHARFVAAQKIIAEGRLDPGHVRYDWLRRGIDRTLKILGVDTEGPEAADTRADGRDRLDSFETIEGRAPNGKDIDRIVGDVVSGITPGGAAVEGPLPAAGDTFDLRHVVQETSERLPPFHPPATPTRSIIDTQVTDWLMDVGSDGRLQTKHPPLDLWNRLTLAQQEAVDFLLARNALPSQAEAPPEKQLVSDPPAAANENTRNYVCTQAVYSCLSNAPSDAPPLWRQSCLKAENLCNQFVNQSRASPFNRTIILNFPDHSRVIIPEGKQGGAFLPPRAAPER